MEPMRPKDISLAEIKRIVGNAIEKLGTKNSALRHFKRQMFPLVLAIVTQRLCAEQ